MKRVVVGLSGGVDSSVAAWLLKEQGYEVIGLFMRNWVDESVTLHDECPWIEDSTDAMMVADQIGIPFQIVDFSEPYRERIVDYMFAEYEAGRTPNPDVLCNREIKFDAFLETALSLNADYVATGHYCQRVTEMVGDKQVHRLIAGADVGKDQSYFLCQLNQNQLAKAMFPIGHLQKSEVRALAERAGLATAKKKDSQGLCFVGKVRLPDFLQQKLAVKPGQIIEIPADEALFKKQTGNTPENCLLEYQYTPEMGAKVGNHQGAHFFTIGQRKGIRVGGKTAPLFVIATDVNSNVVYVGQSEAHPGLFAKALFVATPEVHWIRTDMKLQVGEQARYLARFRYRQPLEPCELHMTTDGLCVIFDRPQKAITPGQFVAWYSENECIGSGVILKS
jgi:tRNA-uridine 2-sulfurtransferase